MYQASKKRAFTVDLMVGLHELCSESVLKLVAYQLKPNCKKHGSLTSIILAKVARCCIRSCTYLASLPLKMMRFLQGVKILVTILQEKLSRYFLQHLIKRKQIILSCKIFLQDSCEFFLYLDL